MLSNKTKGEKRKMFLLLWIVICFGYYHVRFTGGIGIDLVNNIVVSDPGDPAIFADESIKSYLPHKESLEQELEESKQINLNDDDDELYDDNFQEPDISNKKKKRCLVTFLMRLCYQKQA